MKKASIIAIVALALLTTGASAEADSQAVPTPGEVFIVGPTTGVYMQNKGPTKILTVNLPAAGSYTLRADTEFSQYEGTPVRYGARCDFEIPNEREIWHGQQSSTVGAQESGVLSLERAVTTTAPGPVNLVCYGWWNTNIFFNHATLIVQAVPKITKF